MRWIAAVLVALLFTGCNIAGGGGGGTTHLPPSEAIVGLALPLELTVHRSGGGPSGAMDSRCKDVWCHYRLAGDKEWTTLVMTPVRIEQDSMTLTTEVPAARVVGDTAIEYYFTFVFDGQNKNRGSSIVFDKGAVAPPFRVKIVPIPNP